jgi:hypothetical protein
VTAQRDAAWVKSAAPEELATAFDAGELTDLLSSTPTTQQASADFEPVNPPTRLIPQRGSAWVRSATPDQIAAADAAGELVEYQGGSVNDLGNAVDSNGKVLAK